MLSINIFDDIVNIIHRDNMAEKKKKFNLIAGLRSKIRELWRSSDAYREALQKAKVVVYLTRKNGKIEYRFHSNEKPFLITDDDPKMKVGRRIMYKCAKCQRLFFERSEYPGRKKTVKNIAVDHVDPVIDTTHGFVDWNTYIKRMFEGKLQVLCNYPGKIDGVYSCHVLKTKDESNQRKEINKKRRGK